MALEIQVVGKYFIGHRLMESYFYLQATVKPAHAHAVTSIKQSPVFKKGHLFLVLSENFISSEPLLTGHLSYEATFSFSQR
jgi:hypothetical protein